MSGIRAELAIDDLSGCPVARASGETDAPIRDVHWAETGHETVERFAVPADLADSEFETRFEYADRTVHEFDRETVTPCFCDVVEAELDPVADVVAVDGTLHVTVHAGDVARFRDLVGDLSATFGQVRLEYLLRTRSDESAPTVIPLDLDRLTDRQREVLETAHEMGYVEYPRAANATAVADALGIELSTFSEHLAVAQGKLFDELLERREAVTETGSDGRNGRGPCRRPPTRRRMTDEYRDSIHAGQEPDPAIGSRAPPIYQTTSEVFDDTEHAAERFVLDAEPATAAAASVGTNIDSRIQNPTTLTFENRQVTLEWASARVRRPAGWRRFTPTSFCSPRTATPS